MSNLKTVDEISELLHSWKSSTELRARLLNSINSKLSSSPTSTSDAETQHEQQQNNNIKLAELFSTITSSVLIQPALGHDEEMLTSILKLLAAIIGEDDNSNDTKRRKQGSMPSSTTLLIHSRHIASIITAMQNHRKCTSQSSKVGPKVGNEDNNNNNSLPQTLFLQILHKVTKLFSTANTASAMMLLPPESVSSLMSCLLDTDQYFHFVVSSCSDITSKQQHQLYFSLLQHYVVINSPPTLADAKCGGGGGGGGAFLKFGGPAMFCQKKFLAFPTCNDNNRDGNNDNSSSSPSSTTQLVNAVGAISVIHAATSSLEVCCDVVKFGLFADVMDLLDHAISSSSSILLRDSCNIISLHCLGVVQNVLREIGCSKQFWRTERYIGILVRAALDPTVSDESIKSQSMVILLANAANHDYAKNKNASTATNISGNSNVKKDLKRCLTAAHALALIEDVTR